MRFSWSLVSVTFTWRRSAPPGARWLHGDHDDRVSVELDHPCERDLRRAHAVRGRDIAKHRDQRAAPLESLSPERHSSAERELLQQRWVFVELAGDEACSSGEYAMIVIPSSFAAAITPFDSMRRSSRLYFI